MNNDEDIRAKFEELNGNTQQLIKDNLESRLQKYKPTKHRKAYKAVNNFKKRRYIR